MDAKDFYIKFIKANLRMIKFIWSCDYLTDELKLHKVSYFHNLNVYLFAKILP